MTQESASGNAVAERVRAANIAVGGNSSVEAMLANSLRERKPLADDGALHDTVQAAENAASSFVFVPPGTFNENLTIDTAGLTLLGSGRATLIDGGSNSSDGISVTVDNVTIESIRTRVANGSGANALTLAGANATAKSIYVPEAGNQCIRIDGQNSTVKNATVENGGGNLINIAGGGDNSIVTGCKSSDSGGTGSNYNINADNCILSNCISVNSAGPGVTISGDHDNIVIGCRIIDAGSDGITISGNDNIIANNRVSGSSNTDIDDNGSGTTLDANLTGASN